MYIQSSFASRHSGKTCFSYRLKLHNIGRLQQNKITKTLNDYIKTETEKHLGTKITLRDIYRSVELSEYKWNNPLVDDVQWETMW